jgi:hypothetical protein
MYHEYWGVNAIGKNNRADEREAAGVLPWEYNATRRDSTNRQFEIFKKLRIDLAAI